MKDGEFDYSNFENLRDSEKNYNNKDQGSESKNIAPDPLRRPLPDPKPYPMSALDGILKEAAEKLQQTIKAPDAVCGQSVLAAGALAVQGHRNVVIDGRVMPTSENFLTIAESGERKSAVDKEALNPHYRYEKNLKDRYDVDLVSYENEKDAYDNAKRDALNKAKTLSGKNDALTALGLPPQPPLFPALITEEPTYEGLVKLLAWGQPSMGLFSDEAGRMIGGHGMSDEQQLKTIAGFSELWDGKRVTRVRAVDGSLIMYGRRLSAHLMMQPIVFLKLLSNPFMLEQGFMARCLTAAPKSTAGFRPYEEYDLSSDQVMTKYRSKIYQILEHPLPIVTGKRNELAPSPINLSSEAKRFWIAFHNDMDRGMREGGIYASIRGFGSKAAEHALRLAGTLACIENIEAHEIELCHISGGIELTQYYLSEALRLFYSSTTNPDLMLAEDLLAWLQQFDSIYLQKVYQYGPNRIREANTAKRIISILENHRWLTKVGGGAYLDGAPRRDVWKIYKG